MGVPAPRNPNPALQTKVTAALDCLTHQHSTFLGTPVIPLPLLASTPVCQIRQTQTETFDPIFVSICGSSRSLLPGSMALYTDEGSDGPAGLLPSRLVWQQLVEPQCFFFIRHQSSSNCVRTLVQSAKSSGTHAKPHLNSFQHLQCCYLCAHSVYSTFLPPVDAVNSI